MNTYSFSFCVCAWGFPRLPPRVNQTRMGNGLVAVAEKITSLKRRAARAGLSERIDARVCSDRSLEIDDLAGKVDFALAFYVVHEVPDISGLMTQVYSVLRPGGRFFVAEPKGHASADEYQATETEAQRAGFAIVGHPKLKRDWATVFVKQA